jgi:transketolase
MVWSAFFLDYFQMEKKDSYMEDVCSAIRRDIFLMIHNTRCGHFGGSLSCVEILVSLYFGVMCIDPQKPYMDDRDRFVNSKGHATAAYYATLANRGYFRKEELVCSFISAKSCYEEHGCVDVPGVDISTGSLGQGLSVGAGMALSARLTKKAFTTYVLIGDGECQEGQVWEAAMFGAHYKLDNLIAIVDHNGLQVMGRTDDILAVEPLEKKWESFKWEVFRLDGHNLAELSRCLKTLKRNGKPKVVIADTVKGKGISFMENNADWHAFREPDDNELRIAREELGLP